MNREPPAYLSDIPGAVAQLRVPPHSIEAESTVLGGLLLNNSAWDQVADLVEEIDFYRLEHRLIYAAISGLVNATKPADVFTVLDQLEKFGKAAEAGGLAYLNSLAQYAPSAANIRRHAEIVRERSILRKLVSASDETATAAFNTQGKSVDQVLDEAEQRIFSIAQSRHADQDDWEDAASGVVRLLDRIQAQADGEVEQTFIATGLTELDEKLNGGFRPGQLIVIGGRPSMGKTALGMSIELNVAKDGKACGLFSMEMPRAEVHDRRMSMVSYIHLSKIQRPERLKDYDWPALTEGTDIIRNLPLHVSDKAGLTIHQVRARARVLKRRHGLALLTVDYLGLMNGSDPKQPRVYQIEDITKGLKQLGKELGIPVVVLVQLSRETDKRTGNIPIMSDLRDSGSIEQDADVILFVHRPKKANADLGAEWDHYAKIIVAKQRNGPLGDVDVMYVGENTRFKDWPTDQPIPTRAGAKGGSL
jgi:replicative DNA helicase